MKYKITLDDGFSFIANNLSKENIKNWSGCDCVKSIIKERKN